MECRILTFDELDKDTLYDVLRLRSQTFVVDQGVRYLDPDGYDKGAYHMLCTENGRPIGYLRILKRGMTFDTAAIGRIIAIDRRKGVGTEMMNRAFDFLRDVMHEDVVKIEAQVRLHGFYSKLGFEPYGEEFDEGGLAHVNMIKRL